MRDLCLPLIALIAVLTAVLFTVPALAQTSEVLPPICLEVDQWLDANLVEITKRQQLYFDQQDSYWQGLSTHTVEPHYQEGETKEDKAIEPDRLTEKPTDQQAGWLDIFPEFETEKMPVLMIVDVYDGPEGPGYTIRLSILYRNLQYQRAIQFGPERWREHSWQQIQVEAIEPR
jgi:hypothetical protein